jgi:hypothetical protein
MMTVSPDSIANQDKISFKQFEQNKRQYLSAMKDSA